MATAGSLIENIKKLYGDPDADFITDAVGLDWLNRAQKRFVHFVLPLDEFKDYPITAKQPRFDLPTNCIIPIGVMWYQTRVNKLEYVAPDKWQKIEEVWPQAVGIPDAYTVLRRQLTVGPQVPSTNSATALASGAMTSAVTTLNLTAASGTFRTKGFVKVDSEVVEYTAITSTTLTGCVRGVHGTNNTSHASNATVTQMDLIMLYRKAPADLSATSSTPDVPDFCVEYLEKYALYLAWVARGDSEKAGMIYEEFKEFEKETIKTIGRRSKDGLMRIQDSLNRPRWW